MLRMKKQPNVILMFVDDLGIGDVSAFNPEAQFKTRNIDRLAARGMRFEDSHATSALCTPSRYGLLTGRYNWRSRLKSSVLPGDSEALIEKGRRTLAHLFQDQGYRTAAVGKWHLGLDWALKPEKDYKAYHVDPSQYQDPKYQKGRKHRFGNGSYDPPVRGTDIDYSKPISYGPNQLGFDYFFGTPASTDQGPFVYVENDRVVDPPTMLTGTEVLDRWSATMQRSWELGVTSPEVSPYQIPVDMQNKVMELLEDFTQEEKPFFLYYPCHLVHGALLPREEFEGTSGVGIYGDFVLQLDSYVGEIIDFLDKKGIFDDTVFIFTSDNGVSGVADLEHLRNLGHDSSAGYRGHKMYIWEGGHREPTIVSYPQMIEAGSVSSQMVCHADFYRSFADFFGVSLEDTEAEDSVSNVKLWAGEDEPVREDMVHSSGSGGLSIRQGKWKLIFVEGGGAVPLDWENEASLRTIFRPTELYNLEEDWQEQNNVINDHPDRVQELQALLGKYIREGRSTPGLPQRDQGDLPYKRWSQLLWMDDYNEVLEELDYGKDQE